MQFFNWVVVPIHNSLVGLLVHLHFFRTLGLMISVNSMKVQN